MLGSHSEATAAVLGIFLGGLAYGYALFGNLSRRIAAREPASGAGPALRVRRGRARDTAATELRRPDLNRQLHAISVTSFPRLLAHELLPLGVVDAAELPGALHTLSHPRLSDHAARAFFVGRSASLPPAGSARAARAGAENSLVRRYRAARGGSLDDEERLELLREGCRQRYSLCSTLFAQWQVEDPDSPALAEALAKLRAHPDPRLSGAVDAGVLQQLGLLFSETATAGLAPTYEIAAEVEDVFHRYYSHAAPFAPGALYGPWLRCLDDARCERRAEAFGWRADGPIASAHSSR